MTLPPTSFIKGSLLEFYEQDIKPFVDSLDYKQSLVVTTDKAMYRFDADRETLVKEVKGDTLISTVRTYLKAIASIDNNVSDLIVSTGFAVVSPKKSLFSKYFSYLLTSNFIVDKICTLSIGVSYPATNSLAIVDLLCLVPPLAEQKAIAHYLDTKTAQIDQIIQTINTQKV